MGEACRTTDVNLTPKQIAVLQWIAHGKHNGEIALLMNIASEVAVQEYVRKIMDLTGCASRAAAVAWALRRSLIR